ncbi:NlpC/P60 family protein [Micromonospora chalcea]|uniref:C40 family peptidase n=1 Tax=Micromonospora chalcea TaxID=1874 RepID=UPI003715955B
MALHAPRPSSNRSVDRSSVAPRSRWSRFTTALAALVGTAVVLTGGATAAHAEPSVAEIEAQIDRDWNKLEPVIEQVNDVREQLAARRRQADALGRQIAPLQARVDAALGQVGGLAADAYKADSLSTVNALLGSRSPGDLVDGLELLDRFAHRQHEQVRSVAALRDELAAKKKQIDAEIAKLEKLRLKVYGKGGGGPLRPAPCPAGYPGGPAGAAVKFACAQIGKIYVWGAAGPDHFDCSGLTMAAWAKGGVSLPHSARQQHGVTKRISRAELRAGDLVFYYSDLHHVAMYVGDGWVVHASQSGKPITMKRVDDGDINSYGRV